MDDFYEEQYKLRRLDEEIENELIRRRKLGYEDPDMITVDYKTLDFRFYYDWSKPLKV